MLYIILNTRFYCSINLYYRITFIIQITIYVFCNYSHLYIIYHFSSSHHFCTFLGFLAFFYPNYRKLYYLLICFISEIYMFKILSVELYKNYFLLIFILALFGLIFTIILTKRQYVLDFPVIVMSKLSYMFLVMLWCRQ